MKFTALTNIQMDGGTVHWGESVEMAPSNARQLCESGALYPVPEDLAEAERQGLPLQANAAAESLRVRALRNASLQEARKLFDDIRALKQAASSEALRLLQAMEAPQAAPANAEPGPAAGRNGTERTLYAVIRGLTMALAETDPGRFKKGDGSVLVGCAKPATVSGIVGHLIAGRFSALKTTCLEDHVGRALKE